MDKAILNLVYLYDGWGMGLYILVTTLIAGVLTAFLGFEREAKGQSAGLRTHVLVGVGCSLLMSMSIWAIGLAEGRIDLSEGSVNSSVNYDTARIAAGILGGIGFLGAGTIIKNGANIRGLTTAATIWVAAAIGMACGCGFILEAIIATVVSMFFLLALVYVEKIVVLRSPLVTMYVNKNEPVIQAIQEQAVLCHLSIKNINSETTKEDDDTEFLIVRVSFAYHSDITSIRDFCENLKANPNIKKISSNRESPKK